MSDTAEKLAVAGDFAQGQQTQHARRIFAVSLLARTDDLAQHLFLLSACDHVGADLSDRDGLAADLAVRFEVRPAVLQPGDKACARHVRQVTEKSGVCVLHELPFQSGVGGQE